MISRDHHNQSKLERRLPTDKMRVGLKRTAYKVCRRSLILVVHAMPLSSAGARPVKRSLNLAVAARELAAARLSSEEAKKQKLDMQSVSIVRDVGCANSLMPAGERKALAVISANIQSTTPSVLHDAGTHFSESSRLIVYIIVHNNMTS